MLRNAKVWMAAAGLVVAGLLLGTRLVAWVASGRAPTQARVVETDYLCRETKEVFRLPASPAPPLHPRTGKPTLVRAEFDERTNKWKTAPPLDLRQRTSTGR